jgi:hypothetical protein
MQQNSPAGLGSIDTGTIHAVPVPKSRLANQVNFTYNKTAHASLGSVDTDTGTVPVPESVYR